MFYFVGPNSEIIFANEWFQLKQVLQSLSENLYLDFCDKAFKRTFCITFKHHERKLQKLSDVLVICSIHIDI